MRHGGPRTFIPNTAIYVAAGRAVGAREPDIAARNPDYLAEELLGNAWRRLDRFPCVNALTLSYEDAMRNIEVARHVRTTIVRTRFLGEALCRAVASGATQVVLFGAGLDSHAYRLRELLAFVKVFEVDRPSMQSFKKQRVAEVLGGPPGNVSYVPMDFEDSDVIEKMRSHDYDPSQRTFFAMEGVTMYLSEESVHRLFAFVASSPRGSTIVFDYVSRELVQMLNRADALGVFASPALKRFLHLIENESWHFGLSPGTEREFLFAYGLGVQAAMDVAAKEAIQRYLTRMDGTIVGAETIAMASAARADIAGAVGGSVQCGWKISSERSQARRRLLSPQLIEAVVL